MRSRSLLLPGIVCAFAALVWFVRSENRAGATSPSPPKTSAPAPVTIETARVTEAPLRITAESVGTLRANEQTPIKAEVTGKITRIHFDEGAAIKAGTVMVSLDASVQQAEVSKAQANLALQKVSHQRAVELLKKGVGTVERRDEALASLKDAEASLELARARLDKMFLKAPFDGVAGLRERSPGDVVEVGDPITALVDNDPIKIDFTLPEIFLSRVQAGQAVTVLPEALGKPFEGKVYAIDPVVNETGRNLMLRATIPNPDHTLKPGLFARVSLTLEEHAAALMVPEEAIFPVGLEQFVYRIVDGKAVRQKVTVGIRRDGMAEIREGLEKDTEVMTAGHMKVRDGTPVKTAGQSGNP